MSNIKLNDVVMLRDLDGFSERTVARFTGKCCDVVSLERGMSGWNAQIRIKGSKPGDSFTSLNVRSDRLVKIAQMAPGTAHPERKAYKNNAGDVFEMTGVINDKVAGTLHDVPKGGRFRLDFTKPSWHLVYLSTPQSTVHYTDHDGAWLDDLLLAGVIKKVKPALAAPLIGPIPSDDWAYSVLPTLAEALVREVVEYRLPGTAQCSRAFPYLRKTDIGVWMYADTQRVYDNAIERFGAVQGAAKGTRWLYFTNDNAWLNQQEWLHNYHGSFVPALTWPSMGKHMESAFNHGISKQ